VLFEDQCQRGRGDGEVIALLREGLAKASRTTSSTEIYGEFLAIDTAMDKLKEGELCLILVDQVEEAMAHIAAKVQAG
jgi:cyanophycin synthetase